MVKYNWWIVSLFKQYISDFRQVNSSHTNLRNEYWTYLNHRKVLKGFICFCAGHTVVSKHLTSTFI